MKKSTWVLIDFIPTPSKQKKIIAVDVTDMIETFNNWKDGTTKRRLMTHNGVHWYTHFSKCHFHFDRKFANVRQTF